MSTHFSTLCRLLALLLMPVGLRAVAAQALPSIDFTQPGVVSQWSSTHDIGRFQSTAEGLAIAISGGDPYFSGPAANFPPGQPLFLRLRLKSDQGGSCQVFYFTTGPSEAASVRFDTPAGRWVEGRVPLPALGPNYRFRIDPPGTGGNAVIASATFEERGPLPDFDFSTIPDTTQWGSPHDLQIQPPRLGEGLPLAITGTDPYFFGPPRDYPADQLLWMRLRVKSQFAGTAQVFYFVIGPTEQNSVRFFVPAGDWAELRIPLPALAAQTRLRFDPPGTGGECVLGRIGFETRATVTEPAWPTPTVPQIGPGAVKVVSGDLSVIHGSGAWGGFDVRVAGATMASGNTRTTLGYTFGQAQRWVTISTSPVLKSDGSGFTAETTLTDPDGGRWQFAQRYSPGAAADEIEVETRVTVDADRTVVFLPMLTLLPGLGTFGTNKTQAVLPGVEYLENEPSSSEADVIGPGSRRRVPDSQKITFPLMALAAGGKYAGLMWESDPRFAALHDSPDRTFNSGGHLMGLIYPGSDPATREDGSVLPYGGRLLKAGETLLLRATILGGLGNTVVPAVRHWVAKKGLPAVPPTGYTPGDYFTLAARGWLDSQIRDGAKFRHAVGTGFQSQPVADAALYMDWLAGKVGDSALADRLSATARDAIALVSPAAYNSAAIGHVRLPVEALVYGHVAENAVTALNEGNGEASLFRADGSILYQAPATGNDLARTHWSREANGLAATHVAAILERAVFSGDPALMAKGIELLRAMNKFRDTVPRGAQTWEVPLHTPDILASAYLVRAYTLGHEITGEADFLEQARYWAWTGVPFLYLAPPSAPVGLYASIPVLGATQFVAPLWIGLPVQWCGLVYGNAIRRFARHDPEGPWLRLADGIAASGIQQTHTAAEPAYQGLLPDSFDLRNQSRNPVPINPATLLPEALVMEGAAPVHDFRAFVHHGLFVHAPGPITEIQEKASGVSFKVNGWPKTPHYILVTGVFKRPTVTIDGVAAPLQAPHVYQSAPGRLILQLTKPAVVEITLPARDAVFIRRKADGNIELSWLLPATNYRPESSAPNPGLGWGDLATAIGQDATRKFVVLPPTDPARLFRLRREP